MELVLVGDFTKPKADIEQLIRKMGGKVGTKIHDRVAAVISTVDEVQKMGKQMTDARMYDIQVVSEDFLIDTQCPDVDPIGYILSESICDWGGDVSFPFECVVYSGRNKRLSVIVFFCFFFIISAL